MIVKLSMSLKKKTTILLIYVYFSSYLFSKNKYNSSQKNINNHKKYLRKNHSDIKVCLCLICKEEKLYIKDFLDYYKKLGFNHVFLYDNNDINGENLEEVIIDYIEQKFVNIINYRGYKGTFGGPIMAAYHHCYKKNNMFYDWLAFFDVDEYLIINPPNSTIQEFLINSRYKNCENIKINWKLFTDNNKLNYQNIPLNERFKEEIDLSNVVNAVTKIIIKGNITDYYLRRSKSPHDIILSNYSCDTNGNITKGIRIYPPIYKYAILNHYWTKTITEFIQKIKRGHSYYQWEINMTVIKFYFSRFFRYNKKTKEKLKIFNSAFNTTFK